MKITAISPWFGSKRTLAPEIVRQLGPHQYYLEPFCGSMAVLLAKEPSANETVCDLHGALTNLARVLRSPKLAPQLYDHLQRMLYGEDLYQDSKRSHGARAWKDRPCTRRRNPTMNAKDLPVLNQCVNDLTAKLILKQNELQLREASIGKDHNLRKILKLRQEITSLERRLEQAERLQEAALAAKG